MAGRAVLDLITLGGPVKSPREIQFILLNAGSTNSDIGFAILDDGGLVARNPAAFRKDLPSQIFLFQVNRAAGRATQRETYNVTRLPAQKKVSVIVFHQSNSGNFDGALSIDGTKELSWNGPLGNAPPIGDTPTVPQPANKLYRLEIDCAYHPELPSQTQQAIRFALDKSGWLLQTELKPTSTGYEAMLVKVGSWPIVLVAAAIIAVCALAGITVIQWRMIEISNNAVEQGSNTRSIIDTLKQMAADGLIDQETAQAAILALTKDGLPDPTKGKEENSSAGLALVAIGVIAALALSKK